MAFAVNEWLVGCLLFVGVVREIGAIEEGEMVEEMEENRWFNHVQCGVIHVRER